MDILERVEAWERARRREVWDLLGPFAPSDPLPRGQEGERFLCCLAGQHCRPLDLPEVTGRSGLPRARAAELLDELREARLLALVPAHPAPPTASSYHAPRLVLLRPALFLDPLGVRGPEHPAAPDVTEKLLSGALTARVLDSLEPSASVSYWTAYSGRQVDLIVAGIPGPSIGYQFCGRPTVGRRDRGALKKAQEAGLFERGLLVYQGRQACSLGRGLYAVPLKEFLEHREAWTGPGPDRERRRAAERCNGSGA